MKTCPRCERELPEGSFNRDRHNPDGLQTYCRDCQRRINAGRKDRKVTPYTAEELYYGLPEHRLEALLDRWQPLLSWERVQEVTGLSRSALYDRACNPWKYCDSPLPDGSVDEYLLRTLEASMICEVVGG